MSRETAQWLNRNVLIGNTAVRGTAWHYRASEQGSESNHYDGFIPVSDVQRRLFNWEPVKVPTFAVLEDGIQVPTGQVAILANDDNTILGNHGAKYAIHGYSPWLLDNPAAILDQSNGDLGISSAGLLKNRSVAWVEISVPETIGTPEGVDFRPNLLACTSMDSSIPTTYKRTVQLTVCDNTLNIARSEAGQEFRVKHTAKSMGRMMEAREALAIIHEDSADFAAEVAELCQWHVNGKQWNLLLREVIPIEDDAKAAAITRAENTRDALTDLWGNHIAVSPWKGTAFGVLQAFNTYRHHYRGMRGDAWNGGKAERNMFSAIKGENAEADTALLKALTLVTSNA